MAVADELLVKVGVEKLDFLGHRARHFGLLQALGVGQFFLAQLQHLAVVQTKRQHADEQHRSQHHPQDARALQCGLDRFDAQGGAASLAPYILWVRAAREVRRVPAR